MKYSHPDNLSLEETAVHCLFLMRRMDDPDYQEEAAWEAIRIFGLEEHPQLEAIAESLITYLRENNR